MSNVFYRMSADRVTRYKYIKTNSYIVSVDSYTSLSICLRPNDIDNYLSWTHEIDLNQFHFTPDMTSKIESELGSEDPDIQFLDKLCYRILNLLVFL